MTEAISIPKFDLITIPTFGFCVWGAGSSVVTGTASDACIVIVI